jgi:hypothetical protein
MKKKIFIKNFLPKNSIFFYIIFLFVFFLFSSIFILSLFKIVNMWTFSQAHINYSYGFVKRGLFGTSMLFIENFFSLSTKKIFSLFFIILTSINIFLFFNIIKKYSTNFLVFLFLALNPTLIMFSFNDLGGYQRFDAISIFTMLLHCLYACNHNLKNNIVMYKKKLFFIIFPIILISSFIHEIIIWSLPLHVLITINATKENFNKTISYYLIFLILVLIIFLFPVTDATVQKMISDLAERNLFIDAIIVASATKGNLQVLNYEIQTNLLNFYNFKINLFFIILSTLPFLFFINYLQNNNYLEVKIKPYHLIYATFPYLTLFAIGDTGRWISLISFTSLTFMSQFPLKKNIENFRVSKKIFLQRLFTLILFIIIFIYVFFIRMPHCCNLEKKGITIWGGISHKLYAFSKIISKDQDDFYNLNKRFKE